MASTLLKRAKLLRGLLGNGQAYTYPFYVITEVTSRCNLNCPGCRYHSSMMDSSLSPGQSEGKDLPEPLFAEVCDELRVMGVDSIIFTGPGEPFLHPQLFQLLNNAKKSGLHTKLITNGTLLGEEQVEAVLNSGLDVIRVSLWAASPETYKMSYPGTDPGNFERAIDGLNRIRSAKRRNTSKIPSVQLHMPITNRNYRDLDRISDIALQTGCSKLTFAPFNTRNDKLRHMALSSDQVSRVNDRLKDLAKKLTANNIKHNIATYFFRSRIGPRVWEKMPCYISYLHVRIKIDGSIQVCNPCNRPVGNLSQNSLREIWNGKEIQELRRRLRTRRGLVSSQSICDCGYCCLAADNWRVHRVFRWIAPTR